jgi:hypothetical protein
VLPRTVAISYTVPVRRQTVTLSLSTNKNRSAASSSRGVRRRETHDFQKEVSIRKKCERERKRQLSFENGPIYILKLYCTTTSNIAARRDTNWIHHRCAAESFLSFLDTRGVPTVYNIIIHYYTARLRSIGIIGILTCINLLHASTTVTSNSTNHCLSAH